MLKQANADQSISLGSHGSRRGRINAQVSENVVFACTVEGEPGENVQKPQNKDRPNSDTNIISPDCLRFFDGCNHFARSESSRPALNMRQLGV